MRSLLKILHIDTGAELRGGQQQLLMLARGLRDRGHQQRVVTIEGTALEARAAQEGFRVFALPACDPFHAFGALLLRQILRWERFQIVHAHDGLGQTISWLASAGLPIRRVASRRVTFVPSRAFDTRLKYGRMCDAVIAVSNRVQELLVESGVAASQVEVIPDGVEIPPAPPSPELRAKSRADLRLSDSTFAVGYLGALTHEKGFDVALQAMTELQRRSPECIMIAAIAATEARRAILVPCRTVRFARLPQRLEDFFSALDLFSMPSRAEGLGSAALLAMANGVPVIASRVGGLPEIVLDGETGWLVPLGDDAALAAAIVNAAADRERLRAMGEKARERAKLFSSKVMVEKTEAVYKKLTVQS